jgi:hypothetical protein
MKKVFEEFLEILVKTSMNNKKKIMVAFLFYLELFWQ